MEQVNYNSGEVLESLNNKLDRDFNNMAVNSVNFAKYSNNVTNCITEIPQDIKLELVDGTLTLKAGSKVYVPNGFEADGVTPKFDEVIIESDLSTTTVGNNTGAKFISFVKELNGIYTQPVSDATSGATPPSEGGLFYDTTNNEIDGYFKDKQGYHYALPLGIVIVDSNNSFASIDQVFNGFGYIGSTVFALPGVKGLIPNGINEDGSLKNTEFTLSGVKLLDCSNRTNMTDALFLYNDLTLFRTAYKDYIVSESQPIINPSFRIFWYNTEINIIKEYLNGSTTARTAIFLGTYNVDSSSKIASLTTNLPFQALDRNDNSWIAAQAMPSDKYIDLELGATGTQYTAPANGWFHIAKVPGSADTNITMVNTCVTGNTNQAGNFTIRAQASTNGMTIYLNLPVKKGDVAVINYTASGNTDAFRFIYAEGEN